MTNAAALPATLDREYGWLEAVLARRFALDGGGEAADAGPEIAPPALGRGDVYGAALREAGLARDAAARMALIVALAPWLRPQVLDPFTLHNQATGRRFTEFGGLAGDDAGGFRPTRQTLLFLGGGDDLALRMPLMRMFAADAPLVRHALIAAQLDDFAPWMPLDPHPDFVARVIGGIRSSPVRGGGIPQE